MLLSVSRNDLAVTSSSEARAETLSKDSRSSLRDETISSGETVGSDEASTLKAIVSSTSCPELVPTLCIPILSPSRLAWVERYLVYLCSTQFLGLTTHEIGLYVVKSYAWGYPLY
jgi:hypothetical protein